MNDVWRFLCVALFLCQLFLQSLTCPVEEGADILPKERRYQHGMNQLQKKKIVENR